MQMVSNFKKQVFVKSRQFLFFWRAMICALFVSLLSMSSSAQTPSLLLADTYQGREDLHLYLVSEKLDGVRAYWNGKNLISRGGNAINAPSWFTAHFPPQELDGELWMGRGKFDQTSAAIRRQIPDETEWRQINYMLFELPNNTAIFQERAAKLKKISETLNIAWLKAIPQQIGSSKQALEKALATIVKEGGEGLMLHKADAPYIVGRSPFLLKVKPWNDDEAEIIGYLKGKGKYEGMVGALRVRLKNGKEFSLGSGLSDALRQNPPPIGAIVTFRYRELTKKGIPRFASFYRVRDVWELNKEVKK